VLVGDKLQEAMTAEEKQKLFDAIGYQEAGETDYPKEVQLWRLALSVLNCC
jgi:hypothetical protein